MKRFLAITASLICCMGNEMPAKASINKATEMISNANYKFSRAVQVMKSGDRSTACRWFKDGLDGYAQAYVFYPDQKIMDQFVNHNRIYEKHC